VLMTKTEGLRAPDCRTAATYPSWGSDHFLVNTYVIFYPNCHEV